MSPKKILLLSTYPIKKPQHGGQKRTQAIYQAYKQKFADVKHCAIFYRGFYSDFDSEDISLSKSSELLVVRSPLTGDVVIGEALSADPDVRDKFTRRLQAFSPDIIHIEQPFLYLGLKPLLAKLQLRPKIIFGSQNIEAPMKREILEKAGVQETDIAEAEALIAGLEEDLTKESDLVVACTEEDLKFHKELGAKRLVLAPNGAAKSFTNEACLSYWQSKYEKLGISQTVLFVGSAHPPNWTGFLATVGKGLGFIPHDSRVVVAGSICDYFEREIKESSLNIEDATFWLRAISAGRLSEESLGALIELSDVIILPITEGGGSNLKTAEAILADKKIVATSHALRSFEWFKDLPNVWVADSPRAFREAIVGALNSPLQPRTKDQQMQSKKVEWQRCLSAMVEEVSKL